MAAGKEIKTQIASIQNTQKITSAMEMVAASKMKKAQDRMRASRPYTEKILQVIGHLAYAHAEFKHPYMQDAAAQKQVGIIIISSDKGLCGGLNTNLFRTILKRVQNWQNEGAEIRVCTCGRKAEAFFKNAGFKIISSLSHLGDTPNMENALGSVKVMLDAFDAGELDSIYLAYNVFKSAIVQQPTIEQLVPIQAGDGEKMKHRWDYIYEPESKEVLSALLVRYIEALVYQAMVENIACEQSARMVAMKNATDNAGEMVRELGLIYNKARQAAITQEISEIVSGAAAV